MGKTQIVLSDNPTIQEMGKASLELINEMYQTSYDYKIEDMKRYQSNFKFMPPFLGYIHNLMDLVYSRRFETHLAGKIGKEEVLKADSEGELCVYLSILHKCLMKEVGIESNFIQGFFHHKLRKDFPSFIPFGKNQQGNHAWLTVGKLVIDVSIRQQERFYDFKEMPYFLGQVPKNFGLYGWEDNKVVEKYVDKFRGNKSYDRWIKEHLETCRRLEK